jgi:hypothetical protein
MDIPLAASWNGSNITETEELRIYSSDYSRAE